ncbi:MAG: LysR family transcriptional regulator [Fimbriiglobus sp.]|jgi:LysR family hydrogen peroxide-inducible transcriptional activator|nr:LysR family transcriptional regulator [Fimbriiglobus sp.]
MELHQLRYFVKVAELGHFTRAAEACGVSQPSLSQAVAKLEGELGSPLFERLGRGVRLTDAGVKLKERATHILRLVDEARASVTGHPDAGRLVVAAIPTIAPYLLPKVLTAFADACPNAEVEVIEETTERAVGRTAAGEADVLIAAWPLRHDDLHFEPLFTEELLAVLPAPHPLASKPRLTLKELTSERFILLNEAHCLTETTLAFCTRRNSSPLVTARMHQLTTVLELVRLGHGVSLIPAMAAAADPSKHRVYRPISGEKPTRTVAVGWNPRRYQSSVFGKFVEVLRVTGR